MEDYKAIVISGPSGVGKTTIYKQILKEYSKDISFSISATTRNIRDGEEDGKDYHFLSVEEFKQLIDKNDFIEWECVHNNYYGTLKSEIYRIWKMGKHCLLDIDVKGGLQIKEIFENKSFLVFIAPPSMAELETRLRNRGTCVGEALERRLDNAAKEMEQKHIYDTILINENVEIAVTELKKQIKEYISENNIK